MSFIGRAARGLLSGAAGYYDHVAQQQELDRRGDILMQRELALKSVESDYAEQRAANQAIRDRETHKENVHADTSEVIRALPYKSAAAESLEETKGTQRRVLESDRQAGEVKLAYIKGAIEQRNDAASIKLKDKLESGKVQSIEPGEDGTYHVFLKGGGVLETGVAAPSRAPPVRGVDANGDMMVADPSGKTTTYPGMRPIPATDPMAFIGGTTAPVGTKPAAAPAAPAAPAKTYTMADLQYTAKTNNISIDEARRRLNGAGYRLTN